MIYGKVQSVRLYDPLSSVNWLCEPCHLKFGMIPDTRGIVTCPKCGHTNNRYSQYEVLKRLKKEEMMGSKPVRVLSGIRPTGALHLGNYLGAIQFFVKLQEQDNDCFFFIADLHALTTALEDEIDVDQASIEVVRGYLACGLDPHKALIYRQSSIPEVPYLALLLSMIAPEGELRRCTTYKEKVSGMEEKKKLLSLGLLSYPVLMAADILFVNADIVPVGEDQLQHLEIAREIVRRYNAYYGKKIKFTEPQPCPGFEPLRVPGLSGVGKMSKSDGGEDNVIYILDTPKDIERKVMAAKTDTGPVKGQEMSEPMKNLYYLMKLCSSDATYNEYLERYTKGEQRFYGNLKTQLASDIVSLLEPIRERYNTPACSEERVKQLLFENAERVRTIAKRTLMAVQSDFGFKTISLRIP